MSAEDFVPLGEDDEINVKYEEKIIYWDETEFAGTVYDFISHAGSSAPKNARRKRETDVVIAAEALKLTQSKPRRYQVELYCRFMIENRNMVIFLPTGTGKTLVSIMVMARLAKKNPEKKIWFLAPTVPLVVQQADKYMDETGDVAAVIHGQQASFSRAVALMSCQTIFSTPQILLTALSEKKITLEDISLLVFDEAHHTVKNTAYNKIMRDYYWTMSPYTRPLVFGMTASPGACDDYYSTLEKVGQLCLNLNATVRMPVDQIAELNEYAGDPNVDLRETKYTREELKTSYDIIQYLRDMLAILPEEVQRALPNGADTVVNGVYTVALHDVLTAAKTYKLPDVSNLCEHMRATFECWETLADFGHVYSATLLSEEVNRFASRVSRGSITGPTIGRWSAMLEHHAPLKRALQVASNTEIDHHILMECPKFAELVHVLSHYRKADKMRIIIFTKMRAIAAKLKDALSKIEALGDMRHKLGLLVGHGGRSGDQGMKARQQIEVCDRFQDGSINVLVATSVAEEGLDIPECNVVIRYDTLETVTKYVQSRGRARARRSDFVYIFRNRGESKSIERIQFQEKNMRKAVCEIMDGVISFENTLEALSSVSARPFVEEDCVHILSHYCQKVCRSAEILERYMEIISHNAKIKPRYICKLLLPAGVELPNRVIVGETRKNLTLAKRDACYQACVQLHGVGALQRVVGADFVLVKQRRKDDGRGVIRGEGNEPFVQDLVTEERCELYFVDLPDFILADHLAEWLLQQGQPRLTEVSVYNAEHEEKPHLLRETKHAIVKFAAPEDVHLIRRTARETSFDNGLTRTFIYTYEEVYDIKPSVAGTDHDDREPFTQSEDDDLRDQLLQQSGMNASLARDSEGWFELNPVQASRGQRRAVGFEQESMEEFSKEIIDHQRDDEMPYPTDPKARSKGSSGKDKRKRSDGESEQSAPKRIKLEDWDGSNEGRVGLADRVAVEEQSLSFGYYTGKNPVGKIDTKRLLGDLKSLVSL